MRKGAHHASVFLIGLVATAWAATAAAQDRPLETQDPETIGSGQVMVAGGVSYARRDFFPLSGIEGNLWQLPVLGIEIGLSPIADLQLTGGPYDRLDITNRLAAPLANLVAAGNETHSVEDLAIGTKIRLLPERTLRPAVGFRFSVRLPNAKHPSGLGQDTTDFSASLSVGKTMAGVRLLGNLGFTIMTEPLDGEKQNDVLTYGAALTTSVGGGLELVGEVNGRWSTRNGVAPIGTETRGEARIGGRCAFGALRIDAALRFGVTAIDPTIGFMTGLTYRFHAFSLP